MGKAKLEARLAVLAQAEVVGCTLAAAGGELATLLNRSAHFDALIIDEVRPPTPPMRLAWQLLNTSVRI